MADITMCDGNNCPRKNDCYRHTAKANPRWQSWFAKSPINLKTKQCKQFWNNQGENTKYE